MLFWYRERWRVSYDLVASLILWILSMQPKALVLLQSSLNIKHWIIIKRICLNWSWIIFILRPRMSHLICNRKKCSLCVAIRRLWVCVANVMIDLNITHKTKYQFGKKIHPHTENITMYCENLWIIFCVMNEFSMQKID